jgi:hypothetical protein
MKKNLLFVIMTLLVAQVEAAEVVIEACASATVTSETAPGAMNGFAEECINLTETAEATLPLTSEGSSKDESISFAFGGCNTSGMDVDFTLEQSWRYSILKTADEGEQAEASVTYSLGPATVTQGSGSFTEIFEGTIENNLCVDGIIWLSASARVATVPDVLAALSNDYGLNGLFTDPSREGNGFNFSVHEYGLTVFYYGHTDTGERLWLVSDLLTSDLQYHTLYEIDMFEVIDGSFGNSLQGETRWGSLVFAINNCDSVGATLAGIDGNESFSLDRFAGQHGSLCQ